jgi:DNA-binding NarL/FixJ family response regulator
MTTDPPAPTRVLVAEDHPAVRSGLVAILGSAPDLEVVGEAADGPAALDLARRHRPDVVLTDVRMPGATGIEITPQLRATGARVLVISAFDLDGYVLGALAAGADGYLALQGRTRSLQSPPRNLSVEATPRAAATTSVASTPSVAQIPELTPREEDVLRLLAQGFSNQRIARTLVVEVTTVKTHVTHLLQKLQVDSRVQAALWWHANRE